jgi:hypothetical protein
MAFEKELYQFKDKQHEVKVQYLRLIKSGGACAGYTPWKGRFGRAASDSWQVLMKRGAVPWQALLWLQRSFLIGS